MELLVKDFMIKEYNNKDLENFRASIEDSKVSFKDLNICESVMKLLIVNLAILVKHDKSYYAKLRNGSYLNIQTGNIVESPGNVNPVIIKFDTNKEIEKLRKLANG